MSQALSAPGVTLASDRLIALRRIALNIDTPSRLAALPGGYTTRRKGQGLEVADMRVYVPGDDLRHLDRGTTARTGVLHVRQFQEERDRVTLLVADFRPAMFWGLRRAFRSVAAAEALTLIGWDVVESGGRVGLLVLGPGAPFVLPPRGRTRGMLDVIGGLVEAHGQALVAMAGGERDDPALDVGLSRTDRLVPSGAEVVIASGFDVPGEGLADRLNALARRRTPRLILMTDAAAMKLPRGRYPVRLGDGRRLRLRSGGAGPGTDDPLAQVAGRSALVLDAGASIEDMARRLGAVFPTGRAA